MRIRLNGADVDTHAPTLAALLGDLRPGQAVAVNGEVVPRASLAGRRPADGDLVEVVEAVPGG